MPGARPTSSASPSTSGICPTSSTQTSSTTSSTSTRRGAPPTPASAATSRSSSRRCSSAGSRSASTPFAPVTTPGSSRARLGIVSCTVRRTSRRTSPTCWGACRALSWRTRCSPSADSLKSEVRREAATRGLLVADKPDSHDLCFVSDGDTQGYLRARLGQRPGRIVDVDGVDLGGHDGAYAYTIGQRKGLTPHRPAWRRSRALRPGDRAGEWHRHRRHPGCAADHDGARADAAVERHRAEDRTRSAAAYRCGRTAARHAATVFPADGGDHGATGRGDVRGGARSDPGHVRGHPRDRRGHHHRDRRLAGRSRHAAGNGVDGGRAGRCRTSGRSCWVRTTPPGRRRRRSRTCSRLLRVSRPTRARTVARRSCPESPGRAPRPNARGARCSWATR